MPVAVRAKSMVRGLEATRRLEVQTGIHRRDASGLAHAVEDHIGEQGVASFMKIQRAANAAKHRSWLASAKTLVEPDVAAGGAQHFCICSDSGSDSDSFVSCTELDAQFDLVEGHLVPDCAHQTVDPVPDCAHRHPVDPDEGHLVPDCAHCHPVDPVEGHLVPDCAYRHPGPGFSGGCSEEDALAAGSSTPSSVVGQQWPVIRTATEALDTALAWLAFERLQAHDNCHAVVQCLVADLVVLQDYTPLCIAVPTFELEEGIGAILQDVIEFGVGLAPSFQDKIADGLAALDASLKDVRQLEAFDDYVVPLAAGSGGAVGRLLEPFDAGVHDAALCTARAAMDRYAMAMQAALPGGPAFGMKDTGALPPGTVRGDSTEPDGALAPSSDVQPEFAPQEDAEADGADAPSPVVGVIYKAARKRMVKRDKQLVAKFSGSCIHDARSNVKVLSDVECTRLERHFSLTSRAMKPSRRRRRLAWLMWLTDSSNRLLEYGA